MTITQNDMTINSLHNTNHKEIGINEIMFLPFSIQYDLA